MSQESVEASYRRKLASNPDGEMDYITLQVSHPLLSKTYYLVRGLQELTATLETGETITFEPTPMEASGAANNNDMDQTTTFTLPDVGNLLDDELDNIPMDSTELPKFIFRRYVSTDLSYPADGPVVYEAQTIAQDKGRFSANLGTPMLNQRSTGILMTPKEIPLLRGLLIT
jgi:hypothetical protein|nr:MAG: protein of unknown function DUF1833 [Bacteriophage sp.]DAP40289.1 MAG TPA: protein of unknown function (DUF1833) [Caudoviricetes sp.]